MPEVKIPSLCEGCSGLSSFNDENDVHCECGKQIVWFFEKPTVIVCERCEKTFHYKSKFCDICGGKLTRLVKEDNLSEEEENETENGESSKTE